MNFYHEWKRFYIDFSIGRYPKYEATETVTLAEFRRLCDDDPEAHAVVSGFQFHEDPWPRPAREFYVGAQTATVTVEPLNLPCKITGDPS